MEQHPVPQNVSTFQFRLIGDMTLKQFGYLALGAICAYISYKLPLPTIFSWPIAAGFGLLGVGFAFVPIEERPMDVWFLSFFKSAYSPTRYVWQRGQPAAGASAAKPSGKAPAKTIISPKTGPKSQAPYLEAAYASQNRPAGEGHMASRTRLLGALFRVPRSDQQTSGNTTKGAVMSLSKSVPLPMYNPLKWLKDWFFKIPSKQIDWQEAARLKQVLGQERPEAEGAAPDDTQIADKIQQKTMGLEKQLQGLRVELQAKAASEWQMAEMQKQLTEALSQKNKLEQELAALHKKASQVPSPRPLVPGTQRPFMGTVPPYAGRVSFPAPGRFAQPATGGPSVHAISKDAAVKAGLPRLTSFPNVVTGIIKDGEGGLLPGVLITVRDKDGVPLRALKSNKLGQFAASTPLPDGTYIVEIEDPRDRYVFDKAQITLGGRVLPPIEILAKSQKELTREKLEKEIFGNQGIY